VKILALEVEVPGVEPEAFTGELLKAEAAHLWKLHQSGVLREFYFRADRHAAVLMLECTHLDEARTVLSLLPLVRCRLIDFDVIPLVAYPGFARLFEKV
jgi:hypothetical protein